MIIAAETSAITALALSPRVTSSRQAAMKGNAIMNSMSFMGRHHEPSLWLCI